MTGPFGDFNYSAFGPFLQPSKEQHVPSRPLPQIRGKQIDGVLYVRADDVADALETQVPRAAARLIAKLRRR